MSQGTSGPPGPGSPPRKRNAIALQVKLPCATLDAVKARHPELRERRFVLRTRKPPALDTLVRLEARLSTGAPCFTAIGVVERFVIASGEATNVTLALVGMDDTGRELVAWMGGKPPRALREHGESAPAPEAAAPKPAPPPAVTPAPPIKPPAAPAPKTVAPPAAVAPVKLARPPPAPAKEPAPAPIALGPASPPPPAKKPAPAPIALGPASPPPPHAKEPAPAPIAPGPAAPPPAAPPVEAPAATPRTPIGRVAVGPPAPIIAPPPEPAEPAEDPWENAFPSEPPKPQSSAPVADDWADDARSTAPAAAPPKAPAPPAAPPPVPPAPVQAAPAPPPPAAPAPVQAAPPPPVAAEPPPEFDVEIVEEEPADLRALEADLPPREAGAPLITPADPVGKVPLAPAPAAAPPAAQYPPPSTRPAPAPMPRPTMAPAAPSSGPTIVDDDVPTRVGVVKKGRIIGIDLGTTNSAAAVVKDGKPFIIPSREGYSTIPSVVALNDKGKVIVGHAAKGQLLINPTNTVYGMKRLVGRQFNSPVVGDLVGRFSYEIVAGPRGEAAVKLADKIYSLQKISSMVLAEVKELAERWLGEEVTRAVITVPAYYNDNQRQAVRAAGALAGLDVERILNEPTAAAISFAHGRKLQQRVLVYDLGGGTFDTSVLELHGSVYEVISTAGDTFLGGADFDKALTTDLLERFKKKNGMDFTGDRVAYQRVADAAERAKMALSERLTTEISVPFVQKIKDRAFDVSEAVSRAELERLTAALIDRTLRVCDDVLTNCGLKPADINEVLLVGGQSRMPLVRMKVKEFFGKEPSKAVHPDEAVALGAALLADSIQTGEIGGIVLVDVLPMSIGIGLPGGRFKKIVERNTALPHKKTHSVWTSQDQQRMLEIPIFQGENERAQDNEYLGTLVVADLPPGDKGNVVFDLQFSITGESILSVTAEERGTARSVTATFSTQDTPETVRHRLASDATAGDGRGLKGWVKRMFG